MSYELYRHTTLGVCLQDALDEMIGGAQINPQLALKVLKQFDKSVGKALSSRVRTRYNFRGHLKTYRYCDNVWTCLVQDVELKETQGSSDIIHVNKVKIVACDANNSTTTSGTVNSSSSKGGSKNTS